MQTTAEEGQFVEIIEGFDLAADGFAHLVAGMDPAMLHDPTPCSEWDVALLINHVVSGTELFRTLFAGEPAPDRSIDRLGSDPAAAFAAAVGALRAAAVAPGALDGRYQHRIREVDGTTLMQMRINEYLVHGWDLARATGQLTTFPDDLVTADLVAFRDILAGRPRETGGTWAPEREPGADASALDRLAAFCGREV